MLFKETEEKLRIISDDSPLEGIFIKVNENLGKYKFISEYGAYCECSEYR